MWVIEDIPNPDRLPRSILRDLGIDKMPSGSLISNTVIGPEFLRVFRSDTFRFAWLQSSDTKETKLVSVAGYIPKALYDRLIGQGWIVIEEKIPQDWPNHQISFVCNRRLYNNDIAMLKVQVEGWFTNFRPYPFEQAY